MCANLRVTSNYIGVFACLVIAFPVKAEPGDLPDEDPVRLYSTRSEQREAGLKHQLMPWLTAGGLAEFEWDSDKFGFSNRQPNRSSNETSANIQLNASVTPWSFAKGEFVLDYDTDTDRLEVDEAVLSLERNAWELAYGRQYLPFGIYISHFASGPLLEFGETRDIATTLTYDFQDRAELSVAVYQGQARGIKGSGSKLGWSLGMEAWLGDSVSFGISYQSDLADAASNLLSDTRHRYERRVPGLSGYMLWTSDHFEVTAEALGAIRAFRELGADRNQPLAWNLEFANFLYPNFDWAVRLEGSDELEDAAKLRYGASISFRAGQYGSLTLDYLHSRFKHNFATDDVGNYLSRGDQFALQLSVAF